MKVILLKTIDTLGKAGEIVKVAQGYGRNYLIPQGYAEPLTTGGKKQVEIRQKLAEGKAKKDLESAKNIAGKIDGNSFEVKAKSGARGKLYGAVTTTAIADALTRSLNHPVDRRGITLPEPIRMLGGHNAILKLHPEVTVNFKVNVIAAEGSMIDKG